MHSNPQEMKKISYNPILKGKSTPKLKAEISHISENQIQAPFEYSLKKKSKILQILQLAIYQLICNIHVYTSIINKCF